MDQFQRRDGRVRISASQQVISDFTTKVYGWMTLGLGVTAFIAWYVYQSGIYAKLFSVWWVWGFATLGIALYLGKAAQRLSFQAMAALYLTYAACEGFFFGTILPVYAQAYGGSVIWTAFATAALVYGIAVVYGVCTRTDLTSIGKILIFALIGLFVTTLIYFVLSFFIQLTWLNLVISYIGLIIFVGLSAFDAQQIRYMAQQADKNNPALVYKVALMMALRMYINVIMIFWYLLQIFSSNRK
jgi:hypothetical protein